MNEGIKGIIFLGLGIILLVGFLVAFVGFTSSDGQKILCKRYSEEYHYETVLEGGFLNKQCYVLMEDDTKIRISDFNIADYKKPKKLM